MIHQAWKISSEAREEAEVEKSHLLESQVEPLVSTEATANRKSLDVARDRLHEVFQRYRGRAPKFAEELTHWGVKWKLMKSTLHDWWQKDNESSRIAQKAFSDHVFSESELKRDLEEVMKEFLAELEANRNQMLVDAHALVAQSQLPLHPSPLFAPRTAGQFQDRRRSARCLPSTSKRANQ